MSFKFDMVIEHDITVDAIDGKKLKAPIFLKKGVYAVERSWVDGRVRFYQWTLAAEAELEPPEGKS